MTPDKILASFREAFGTRILGENVVCRYVGTIEQQAVHDVWITVDQKTLHEAVRHLCETFSPHLSVISGDDLGESVAFNYHFTVGWGEHYGEINLIIRVIVPKSDFTLPTITDLLPGALTSEREKQEFHGVTVEGIPDGRNLFLPEEMTIHPWSKDQDQQDKVAREVKRLVKWETRDE